MLYELFRQFPPGLHSSSFSPVGALSPIDNPSVWLRRNCNVTYESDHHYEWHSYALSHTCLEVVKINSRLSCGEKDSSARRLNASVN
jgi:hypothetical protein